ncbi:hypothetical protein [Haloarcula nitratireducens]|uniref:Uncharacterized protein n=1 Tax=Haloarcula nitratireducens TaxID=2487749 RepID=A0AAW4PFH0_9EURY|nr:hypothetical protein [Halomicroarcula nitratireducens]MBX0296306.1 hypothetical protein [Halomicroarcula nitratireducens]
MTIDPGTADDADGDRDGSELTHDERASAAAAAVEQVETALAADDRF